MPQFKDIAGQRFGRLTAVRPHSNPKKMWRWLCRCDCGEEIVVQGAYLSNGHTRSCGCLHTDIRKQWRLSHGHCIGGSGSRTLTYASWQNMRDRCLNTSSRWYKNYGGRGIGIIHRWDIFPPFLEDMGERKPGYDLHRIDNDKDYSPENCRWFDRLEHRRLHALIRRLPK